VKGGEKGEIISQNIKDKEDYPSAKKEMTLGGGHLTEMGIQKERKINRGKGGGGEVVALE